MSTPVNPRSVVTALVEHGLVDPARSDEAVAVVSPLLSHEAASGSAPVRRRLAEVTGYVGAAFVVGAAVLFLSTTWADLGTWTQVTLLVVSAAVLGGAGAVVARPESRPIASSTAAVRRRLASVLLTGAAGCVAFAVGVAVAETTASEEQVVLIAATTALLVVVAGYRLAPSVVGQLGAVVAALTMVPSGLASLESDVQTIAPLAVSILGLGVVWTVAAERRWWHESEVARVLGCAIAVVGAQMPVLAGDTEWLGYALTAGVAVAAFTGYLASRAWAHLATGVVGVTLVVPEALHDAYGESLGAAGVLLAAGVTLLGAALLGLRLRHEVTSV